MLIGAKVNWCYTCLLLRWVTILVCKKPLTGHFNSA